MFDKWRNRRFDKQLSNIATWRLMQELNKRGTLRSIHQAHPIKMRRGIIVDMYDCPLLQQFSDDGLPLFAPRTDADFKDDANG